MGGGACANGSEWMSAWGSASECGSEQKNPQDPPESLRGSDEGRQMRMYWTWIEVWCGALGWSWVEPDGRRRWVWYPAQVDCEPLIWECHEGWVGGHLG